MTKNDIVEIYDKSLKLMFLADEMVNSGEEKVKNGKYVLMLLAFTSANFITFLKDQGFDVKTVMKDFLTLLNQGITLAKDENEFR